MNALSVLILTGTIAVVAVTQSGLLKKKRN